MHENASLIFKKTVTTPLLVATMQGYIYILTNPSFREDWIKVVITDKQLSDQYEEYNSNAMPVPTRIQATITLPSPEMAETLMKKFTHQLSLMNCLCNNRFYNITLHYALQLFRMIIADSKDVTITEIAQPNDAPTEIISNISKPKNTWMAFPFLRDLDIPIGSKLMFTPSQIEVVTASDHTIIWNDMEYTLMEFAMIYLPINQPQNIAHSNPDNVFSYNGKTLGELRCEIKK